MNKSLVHQVGDQNKFPCSFMDSISFFVVYSGNKKRGKNKHSAYKKHRNLLTLTIHTPADILVPHILTLKNTMHVFLAYCIYIYIYIYIYTHTGCPRRNVPDFGRMFLMLTFWHPNFHLNFSTSCM